MTKLIKPVDEAGRVEAVREACHVLDGGGLVAFPTETVYGVGCRVDRPDAVEKLRQLKDRTIEKAFTVHIADTAAADLIAPHMGAIAKRTIRKAWPGPLTLIVAVDNPAESPLVKEIGVSAIGSMYYDGRVGLRCPSDPISQLLLKKLHVPLVAASANLAGQPAPFDGQRAYHDLKNKVDLFIDGGETQYRKASTIVSIDEKRVDILREGVYDRRTVDRLTSLRLLFVCTGNTCRSPMAEGLASQWLANHVSCPIEELTDHRIEVGSAGLAGGYGNATSEAVAVMGRRGIKLTGHRSQFLTVELVEKADYVFAMTQSHRRGILGLASHMGDRVCLLVEGREILDPIGGSVEDYESCARDIEAGVHARLKEIET